MIQPKTKIKAKNYVISQVTKYNLEVKMSKLTIH